MCVPALFALIPGIAAGSAAATTAATVASTALTLGSTAFGIAGIVGQVGTAEAVGKRQAKIAEHNAQLADAQSLNARNRAEAASSRVRTGAGRLRGRQRAIAAARGLDPTTGTAGAILDETSILSTLDARQAVSAGRSEAAGFTAQAFNQRARARLATVTPSAGAAIGGAILQGAGAVASKWQKFRGSSGVLFDDSPTTQLPAFFSPFANA